MIVPPYLVQSPEFQAVVAAAFADGVRMERERCRALLELGRVSGDTKFALYAIREGAPLEEIEPEFLVAARGAYARSLTLLTIEARKKGAPLGELFGGVTA